MRISIIDWIIALTLATWEARLESGSSVQLASCTAYGKHNDALKPRAYGIVTSLWARRPTSAHRKMNCDRHDIFVDLDLDPASLPTNLRKMNVSSDQVVQRGRARELPMTDVS